MNYGLIQGVARETISVGMALGLMRYDVKDEMYELTPIGDAWLRQWCEQKLSELELELENTCTCHKGAWNPMCPVHPTMSTKRET
jgi:hypothetical protein